MSTNSNFDRMSEAWLADGPTQLADRVLDAALDEVHLTRQRRRLPVLWRFNPMPVPVRLAAAAVIGVLLVGVIYLNLPGRNTVGGPSPSPTQAPPSPTQAPPSPTLGSGPVTEGTLAAGRYSFNPSSDNPTLTVLADVPSGWFGHPTWAVEGPGIGANGPNGIGVALLIADGLFSDPCHWDLAGTAAYDQPGDVEVGPTAMDLVDALRANSAYVSSTPQPVTFGEFAGYILEIQLPADTSSDCDKEDPAAEGRYFVFSGKDAGMYAQGDGNIYRLSVVDVGETRIVVVLLSYPGTSQADLDIGQGIVDSMEFTP